MYNRQYYIMDKLSWLAIAALLYMAPLGSAASTARDSNLVCEIPSGCPCPGETVTCNCVAVAGTHTIEWRGSIFEDGDESCTSIAVQNINIAQLPGRCKGIVAYGYSAPDGHFISKMNFTATSWHSGKTVQCFIDHGPGQSQSLVGNVSVSTTPDTIEPLQNARLLNATSRYLIFNWTRALSNCSLVQYIINATKECGICPDRTNSTQVRCSLSEDPIDELKTCIFQVTTVICGDFDRWKLEASVVIVKLKLPDRPTIECEPIFESGLLQSFTLNITEMGAFFISDDINGAAVSYTVTYSDVTSGNSYECDSKTIMVSSCENRICSHRFQVSSMPFCKNSMHMIVAVFATNLFGNGNKSIKYLSDPQFNREKVYYINTKDDVIQKLTLVVVVIFMMLILVVWFYFQFRRYCNTRKDKHTDNWDNNDDENQGGMKASVTSSGDLESCESEKEVDLSTTHALCLEVKEKDINPSTSTTVHMATFAKKYLPGYRSEWQCGYYEFMENKLESFTPDQIVLLMKIEKKEKKIVELVETTISNLIDDHNDLRNVELSRVKSKKRHVFVFIKSRNDDYELSLGQKFLYCAHFSEVCGHVELCYKKENDNRTIYQFATEQFKLFREGFAYREVCSEDDMTWRKLLNKSVRLSKKTTDVLPAKTDVYRSANLNAHILIQHKFNKLPEHHDNLISSCTEPLDHSLFIHTSGHSSRVGGRRILFCIEMDRIDKCSYSKVGKVLRDSETTRDLENSSELSPTMPMVAFGKKFVGTHYDQQLGYGYREIYQGNNIRLKLYKKVVLMDEDNNLFAGSGAQRLIGLHEGVQEFEVADLSKTHWRQIFVESRGENRKLELESSFLFYVPLTKLDAYHEIYVIKKKCKMFEFAKSKIPGFNPTRGYGYCQITDELLTGGFPQSTVIILMSKEKQLFSGAGAYYYAMDAAKFKAEWECGFVQTKSFDAELIPGTKFLYCEYSQL